MTTDILLYAALLCVSIFTRERVQSLASLHLSRATARPPGMRLYNRMDEE